MQESGLSIDYLPVDDLKPYEHNAREHKDKDIQAIMESIKAFGFNDPIGIWQGQIVEGHGRLEAAKRLGLESVPVIHLDHLTDEQRRAYALAHNRTAELSGWDFYVLAGELDGIKEINMQAFGFDDGSAEEEKYQEKAEKESLKALPDSRVMISTVSIFGDESETFLIKQIPAELANTFMEKKSDLDLQEVGGAYR